MNDYLTAKQVIELLKIDRTTLYRMLRESRISGVKVGSQWRFQKSEINSLLQPSLAPESAAQSSQTNALPLHCLQLIQEVFSDMIQVGAITTDAKGEPLSKFSNPCKFCELIQSSPKGLKRCQKSWKDIEFADSDTAVFAVCHAGLNYSGANISMEGKKLAKLIAGQFYNRKPDSKEEEKRIKNLAKELSLDEKKLLHAAADIAIIDERIAQFLGTWLRKVAKSFASMGHERQLLVNRLNNIAELSKL